MTLRRFLLTSLICTFFTGPLAAEEITADNICTMIKKAEQGDVDTALQLGKFFANRLYPFNFDKDKSLKFYKIAAESGNGQAMAGYARTLVEPHYRQIQDINAATLREAREWNSKALALNVPSAYYNESQFIMESGYEKTEAYIEKALQLKDPYTIYIIAEEYASGRKIERIDGRLRLVYDPLKALDLCQQIADIGDTDALAKMGYIYLYGPSQNMRDTVLKRSTYEKNEKKGLIYLEKAAHNNKYTAIVTLINYYKQKNLPDKAQYWQDQLNKLQEHAENINQAVTQCN